MLDKLGQEIEVGQLVATAYASGHGSVTAKLELFQVQSFTARRVRLMFLYGRRQGTVTLKPPREVLVLTGMETLGFELINQKYGDL